MAGAQATADRDTSLSTPARASTDEREGGALQAEQGNNYSALAFHPAMIMGTEQTRKTYGGLDGILQLHTPPGATPEARPIQRKENKDLDLAGTGNTSGTDEIARGSAPKLEHTKQSKEEKETSDKAQKEGNDKTSAGFTKDGGGDTWEADLLKTEQFRLFSERVATMVSTLKLKEDPIKLAEKLWGLTVDSLKNTTEDFKNVASQETLVGKNKDGTDRLSQRKDLGSKAFKEIVPKFDDLTKELKGLAKIQGEKATHWGFWSTGAAKELALKHCDMSLEGGSIGFLFDGLNINGAYDMQMWGALSNAYAEAAVDTLEARQIECFIGPYLSDLTVYNLVERPVIDAGIKKNPNIQRRFHAVATKDLAAREADLTVKGQGAAYEGVVATCATREEAAAKANAHADRMVKKSTAPAPSATAPSSTAPTAT